MNDNPNTKTQPANTEPKWWKKNRKKVLIIGGTAVLVAIGSYFGIKYRSELSDLSRSTLGAVKKRLGAKKTHGKNRSADIPTTRNIVDIRNESKQIIQILPSVAEATKSVSDLPTGFLDNLSGEMLTATELGRKLLMSAREVNKRLVAAGLQTRCPNGEYQLTDLGKKLGETTLKTTAWGYPFANNEWDAKVIDLLVSPEEMLDIQRRLARCEEIMAGWREKMGT